MLALATAIAEGVATPRYFSSLAVALRALVHYDAITIIRHQLHCTPDILHHDFQGRAVEGLNRYLRWTHSHDPFITTLEWQKPAGTYRLRDIARRVPARGGIYLILNEQEEIGYRTVDWPDLYEEVGIRLPMDQLSVIQIALYRRTLGGRSKDTFSNADLNGLAACIPLLNVATRRQEQWERPLLAGDPAARLTTRERQVITMILRGHKSKSIAKHLGISLLTIKYHRKNAYRKLGIATMASLFSLFDRFCRTDGSPERAIPSDRMMVLYAKDRSQNYVNEHAAR